MSETVREALLRTVRNSRGQDSQSTIHHREDDLVPRPGHGKRSMTGEAPSTGAPI
jgi:hypothetical protein